jgi:tetratricopeptide (TPR) repeat protein
MSARRTVSHRCNPILRLTQTSEGEDTFRVEVALADDAPPRQTATVRFSLQFTVQDREDLRWYLEDYLQYPFDPAPTIAARIEKHMADIGMDLFKAVFQANADGRKVWAALHNRLHDTRVEVVTEAREATVIPWEIIRAAKTGTPLALRTRAFVRVHSPVARPPQLSRTASGPIRILLVICRPGGRDDVPFRSVASRLVQGLGGGSDFHLEVLRLPTIAELQKRLRAANEAGQPYHVVHFDGHGTYADLLAETSGRPPKNLRGYLVFENPEYPNNTEYLHGAFLGKTLTEAGVSLLVLNACRSAHAEALAEPGESLADDQTRPFGSLAQEVMNAGVPGVVAMRYNIYVVTAAQFVADLYALLTQGYTLGEAVTLGRQRLFTEPLREIAYTPRPLQDWLVPMVYEATPIALFSEPTQTAKHAATPGPVNAMPVRGRLDPKLLKCQPDVGFFGRDETLLALDRALDTQSIDLLHAFAGRGKTTTAAEFARWYALTGGVDGPVLFASFGQPKPLTQVLDETIEPVFGGMLEQRGRHWLALSASERREETLQLLREAPLLWIWDNVEPVAGFPAGTTSLSAAEQQELADFLRAARETQGKFLLTSRHDEHAWLGDLPVARIPVPPMPMQERVQMVRALSEEQRRQSPNVAHWWPLLQFTQGNPLTIRVVVGQVLHDGLKAKEEIEAFVARLRAGEAVFDDEISEGRANSLGASLSYGFEHIFSAEECKQLALLHLFQGFLHVSSLRAMGHADDRYGLPTVRGMTEEHGIALLNRAAEVGLLTAYAGGFYGIHPALPWYFRRLFETAYRDNPEAPVRAFVDVIGSLGGYLHDEYYMTGNMTGNQNLISLLELQEANLLHARRIALAHAWWARVLSIMKGLRVLYEYTGRSAVWARLVEEIVPYYVDSETDGPLPGRGEEWGFITYYRALLARGSFRLAEAERLLRLKVDWARQGAGPFLDYPPETLANNGRRTVEELAGALHDLAQVQWEQGKPECVATYEEALNLAERVGDHATIARCAFNLGHAHLDIHGHRDFDQAEHWYRHSLELSTEGDRLGRAKCLGQLGVVALERFKEATTAHQSIEVLLQHLHNALSYFRKDLEVLPQNAVHDLTVVHGQLGYIYGAMGDPNHALSHYREALRYRDMEGNVYGAATNRFHIAVTLFLAGHHADAREYAYAALRNFETVGDRATEMIQQTRGLIKSIEQTRKDQGG